jgi:hypothetical protein
MTAATLVPLAVVGGIVADVDLWFPGQQDPVGYEPGWRPGGTPIAWPDPLRYVVWVDMGRPHRNARDFHRQAHDLPELAPRRALHLIECRSGSRQYAP